MKIRVGFVSNSSSSSYVITGTNQYKGEALTNRILRALGIDPKDNLCPWMNTPEFRPIENGQYYHKPTGLTILVSDYEDYSVGLDMIPLIETDKGITYAREQLVKICNDLGIQVQPEDFELSLGEISG